MYSDSRYLRQRACIGLSVVAQAILNPVRYATRMSRCRTILAAGGGPSLVSDPATQPVGRKTNPSCLPGTPHFHEKPETSQ